MTKKKKEIARNIRKAKVTLKRPYWNGRKKLLPGKSFTDPKCYDGKYSEELADVVFDNEKPEKPEKPEGSDELKEILK